MDEDGDSTLEADYFIRLTLELNDYEIENNSCVYGKNEAIFLVNTLDYDTYVILSNIELTTEITKEGYELFWKSEVRINDIKYTAGLIRNQVTLFNMLLMKENNYDYF